LGDPHHHRDFGFTRNLYVSFVAFVLIPFSLLAAIIVFDLMGKSVNTMVLGGLAVALGVVIDDAVIGVENILRRLRENEERSTRDVILDASVEVRAPVVYATFVLALTMAPVFFLTGLQGAFFSPLAASFVFATLASLVDVLTLTPALAFLLLKNMRPPEEPRILQSFKRFHGRMLGHLLNRPRSALAATLALGFFCGYRLSPVRR
jgi:Cu/Ag efflux pump CusA